MVDGVMGAVDAESRGHMPKQEAKVTQELYSLLFLFCETRFHYAAWIGQEVIIWARLALNLQ